MTVGDWALGDLVIVWLLQFNHCLDKRNYITIIVKII